MHNDFNREGKNICRHRFFFFKLMSFLFTLKNVLYVNYPIIFDFCLLHFSHNNCKFLYVLEPPFENGII